MENYFPTRLLLNEGNLLDFSSVIESVGKTFLVISEKLQQKRPDIIAQIPEPLEIFSEVESNPDIEELQQVKIPQGITQVIGIGGGSKLDAAKAIFARVLTEDQHSLKDLIQNPQLLNEFQRNRKDLNFILIPTTFGSSSELTKWGTLWDWKKKKKYSISHEILYADTAYIAPELSLTVPHEVTAYTGLDTFSHALESFWNKEGNFLTRHHSLKSIQLCIETLPVLLKERDSLKYRTQMAKASLLAGLAFSQTRTAAAHALSYPLTLHHQIPHGYACSLTLGVIFDYNLPKQPQLHQILDVFQNQYGSGSFNQCFQRFLEECEVPCHLSDFGVKASDIPRLVQDSFHPERFNNMAHTLSAKEVEQIFQAVL